MRKTFKSNVRFMLMNSFSTSEDTLDFLKKYPELANDPNLELVQVLFLLIFVDDACVSWSWL